MPSIARRATEGCAANDRITPVFGGVFHKTATGTHISYTYIIFHSISHPDRRYIGSTADLKAHFVKHNAGEVTHISKFKPWKEEACIAFELEGWTHAFEFYLKTGSGHAFAKRHFRNPVSALRGGGLRPAQIQALGNLFSEKWLSAMQETAFRQKSVDYVYRP